MPMCHFHYQFFFSSLCCSGITSGQYAKFCISIFRADGLPKMKNPMMGTMKKVLSRQELDMVDPFVEVAFGNLKVCFQ